MKTVTRKMYLPNMYFRIPSSARSGYLTRTIGTKPELNHFFACTSFDAILPVRKWFAVFFVFFCRAANDGTSLKEWKRMRLSKKYVELSRTFMPHSSTLFRFRVCVKRSLSESQYNCEHSFCWHILFLMNALHPQRRPPHLHIYLLAHIAIRCSQQHRRRHKQFLLNSCSKEFCAFSSFTFLGILPYAMSLYYFPHINMF